MFLCQKGESPHESDRHSIADTNLEHGGIDAGNVVAFVKSHPGSFLPEISDNALLSRSFVDRQAEVEHPQKRIFVDDALILKLTAAVGEIENGGVSLKEEGDHVKCDIGTLYFEKKFLTFPPLCKQWTIILILRKRGRGEVKVDMGKQNMHEDVPAGIEQGVGDDVEARKHVL
ncbi:hypothetical protein L1987_48845 [Smallanthus sonchifolius]|uniref:Uncharacterized protein n=1 Tax=Smallanthus sonchifolius TaxID=185202 RepID=A0ACB9FU64_9ASTR|nr:hypothetical protein L1987_48845 [Smallanthus sonchifolius]